MQKVQGVAKKSAAKAQIEATIAAMRAAWKIPRTHNAE